MARTTKAKAPEPRWFDPAHVLAYHLNVLEDPSGDEIDRVAAKRLLQRLGYTTGGEAAADGET